MASLPVASGINFHRRWQRQSVVDLALQEPELSPRELATAFVDQQQYFVSEASVYRLLRARGLITSPAFILLKAADHTFFQ